jgi:hyperosmotically inducible protein
MWKKSLGEVRPMRTKNSQFRVLAFPLILSMMIVSTTIFSVAAFASPTTQDNQTAGAADAAINQKSFDRITKEVRHELVMLPYYGVFDSLSYKVDPDGTVTLIGQVARPVLKSDAEGAVKRIEGVTKVVNNIEVLPTSIIDDQIRRATYRAIFGNPALNEYQLRAVPPIHILVKNGHVTLEGVVARDMDKQIAGVQANSVPGVFSVTNNLIVEEDSKKGGKKK